MKAVVIGCGHVGLVTGAGLAEVGHDVVGVDADADRLAQLQRGGVPFYEPGLQELVARNHGGRLSFEADTRTALEGADVVFICVNTPPRADGRLSLVYVEQVARTVTDTAPGPVVIVEKSTVPVRTSRRIVDVVRQAGRQDDIEVACNPEFLREGSAVHDFMHPDRIVVGLNGGGRAEQVMRDLYAPVVQQAGCPLVVTDVDTAEMIKHASNSFLALKISYINAVAAVCERTGADVDLVAHAMGLDPRIGPHFLNAGVGYGGSCFPKDVAAFQTQAAEVGIDLKLLDEVRRINASQRQRILGKLHDALWNLEGKTVAVWGLAFKPGTDDVRESPALDVIPALIAEGAHVRAYDPAAGQAAKTTFADAEVVGDRDAAADGADALVVLTEWQEFREAGLGRLRTLLRRPVVVDGRNLWPVDEMAGHGFTYLSFGRPDVIAGEIRRP